MLRIRYGQTHILGTVARHSTFRYGRQVNILEYQLELSETRLFPIKASPSAKIAAIFYFLAAFIALALAFVGYFLMHRMVSSPRRLNSVLILGSFNVLLFQKFYRTYDEIARSKKRDADNAAGASTRPPYWAIFKKVSRLHEDQLPSHKSNRSLKKVTLLE